jgi:hypothetical protein
MSILTFDMTALFLRVARGAFTIPTRELCCDGPATNFDTQAN